MIFLRTGLLILLLPWVVSCASLALSGVTMGVGYSFMNEADKTTNHSLRQVYKATVQALNKMGIKITDTNETGKVREINATTERLAIAIELEKVTLKTTKISVTARKKMFLRDKSTADEIIHQTQKILDEQVMKTDLPGQRSNGEKGIFNVKMPLSIVENWI